jgi:hypothetical protein
MQMNVMRRNDEHHEIRRLVTTKGDSQVLKTKEPYLNVHDLYSLNLFSNYNL